MSRLVGKNPRGTTYKVTFDTLSELQVAPSKVTLIQKMYSHDILLLEYPSLSATSIRVLNTQVPVSVRWQQGNRAYTWVGYVTAVAQESAAQTTQKMIVRCVGPSWELKNSQQQIYKNKTIPEIAQIISKQFGFSCITEKSKSAVRLPSVTFPGGSYWEWLVEHAKEIGYGLHAVGTRIYLLPFKSFLDGGSTDVPILQMWQSDVPNGVSVLDRTLNHFKAEKGEFWEGGSESRAQKIIQGIDPITGKEFKRRADPKRKAGSLRKNTSDTLFTENVISSVVTNTKLAAAKAEGAALLAQFSTPATAKAQGDPRFRPFAPVFIEGTGSETDGYWMISEVTHEMYIQGEYTASLKLLTDGSGKSAKTSLRQPTAAVVGQVNLQEAAKYKKNRLTLSPQKASVLKMNSPVIKRGNQGGNRTNTKWKATARSKAEGR